MADLTDAEKRRLEEQSGESRKSGEALEHQAQTNRRDAEDLDAKAEDLHPAADAGDPTAEAERRRLEDRSADLERSSESLERQAPGKFQEAEQLEAQAHAGGDKTDMADDNIPPHLQKRLEGMGQDLQNRMDIAKNDEMPYDHKKLEKNVEEHFGKQKELEAPEASKEPPQGPTKE